MKVILIRPYFNTANNLRERFIHNRVWSPLSLSYCAQILKNNGIETTLLDAQALKISPTQVAQIARGSDLALVTSSPIDRWECPNLELAPVAKTIRALKKIGIKTALCGVHGTVRPNSVMELIKPDLLIQAEPESAILQIVRGKKTLPGIIFSNQEISPPYQKRAQVNLESLPFPAYNLLDIKVYKHLVLGGPCLVLEGSRGCPHQCTACLKAMYGKGYRIKSGEKIFEETARIKKDLGAKAAVFIDLDFCLNRAEVEIFCKKMITEHLDLNWCCTTHPNSVDPELLSLMGKAGCRLIHYGIESASKRVLKLLGRPLAQNDLTQILINTSEAGIASLGFFMFGAFDETAAERKQTLNLALSLPLNLASFHICNPLPGTKAQLSNSHMFTPIFPDQDQNQLNKFTLYSWFRFYLRPSTLLKALRLAFSNRKILRN